jgi:hypothetical protein
MVVAALVLQFFQVEDEDDGRLHVGRLHGAIGNQWQTKDRRKPLLQCFLQA